MRLISKLSCMINRHRPDRRKVAWTGKHFSGKCRYCGQVITRKSHRKWRIDHAAMRYGRRGPVTDGTFSGSHTKEG